jgi:hypothetical protein
VAGTGNTPANTANTGNVTINSGSLSVTSPYTVNIGANGILTNNLASAAVATIGGTGSVTFTNGGTIAGTAAGNKISFNNLILSGGSLTIPTTGGAIPTVTGTFTINGGSVTNPPIYGTSSTLYYGLTYTRAKEWNATTGTVGTTPGYPNNVTIGATPYYISSATLTPAICAGLFQVNSSITASLSGMAYPFTSGSMAVSGTVDMSNTSAPMNTGALTVNAGGTVTMNTAAAALNAASLTINSGTTPGAVTMGSTTSPMYISGNLVNNGSLTLSSASGGDIHVGGNWTRGASATFAPATRAVFLNGTTPQNIAFTGGGTEVFDYLIDSNSTAATTGAGIVLSSSPATNITVDGTSGGVLQLLNTGSIDLKGQTLNLTGSGGNIQVSNTHNDSIWSSVAGGTINISGYKTVTSVTGTNTLTLGSNVNTTITGASGATVGVNFGSSLTTLNGSLTLNSYSYVDINAPAYGTGSNLIYNSGGAYSKRVEWGTNTSAYGYPYNVVIQNGTYVNAGSLTTTDVDCSGSLTIGNANGAGTLDMNGASYNLRVGQNITIGTATASSGTLILSTTPGYDAYIKGNWTRNAGGTFTSNSRAVFFTGAINSTITGPGNETFPYLLITKSASTNTVTLANDVTVSGILTLTTGIVNTTSSYNMILSSTAATALGPGYSASSYINGNLRRYVTAGTSYDLPVGTASSYQLANIKFDAPSLGTTTYLTAKFNSGAPTAPVTSGANACVVNNSKIGSVLSVGSWTITPDNQPASGATYTATLSMTGVTGLPAPFTDANGHTVTTADLIAVVKRDAGINGGNWTGTGQDSTYGIQAYGTHYDSLQAANTTAGTATVTRSGIPSFSDFAIGVRLQQSTFALPVQLIYFAAEKKENDGYLTWATASEINNDHFDIERSVDGVTFVKVGTVAGHGNSNQTISYDYTDPNIVALNVSTVYYRLNQVDIDGHSQYSNIAAVDMTQGENTFHITSVYPNPFTDHFSLSIYTPAAQTLRIAVYNVTGQIVSDETVNADAGLNVYNVSKLSGLASGFYTLNINAGLNNYSYKVIKGE